MPLHTIRVQRARPANGRDTQGKIGRLVPHGPMRPRHEAVPPTRDDSPRLPYVDAHSVTTRSRAAHLAGSRPPDPGSLAPATPPRLARTFEPPPAKITNEGALRAELDAALAALRALPSGEDDGFAILRVRNARRAVQRLRPMQPEPAERPDPRIAQANAAAAYSGRSPQDTGAGPYQRSVITRADASAVRKIR